MSLNFRLELRRIDCFQHAKKEGVIMNVKGSKLDMKSAAKKIFKYIPISGAILGLIFGIVSVPYKQFSSNGKIVETVVTPLSDYLIALLYTMMATIAFLSLVGCIILLLVFLFNIINSLFGNFG